MNLVNTKHQFLISFFPFFSSGCLKPAPQFHNPEFFFLLKWVFDTLDLDAPLTLPKFLYVDKLPISGIESRKCFELK